MAHTILLATLTALSAACECTARATIWGWRRPVLRAPVWVAGLVLLVPLHGAPELLVEVSA